MADTLSTLTLAIRQPASSGAEPFTYNVLGDDRLLHSQLGLTAAQSAEVREFSRRFGALFERRGRPRLPGETTLALGNALFDWWLKPVWDALHPLLPSAGQVL